jgi:putative sporulation protein YtaF
MQIGALLSGYLSPHAARAIGACLLIGIGGWALYQLWRRKLHADNEETDESHHADEPASQAAEGKLTDRTVMILELKRLGIVIQILRTPQIADVDRSGVISASEAVLLGFALSLDSFGAGLGAAMIGFSPLLTALVLSTASGVLLLAGLQVGFRFAAWPGMRALSVLPGVMLIAMGLLKLL